MNARWLVLLVACTAVLLVGAPLAAEPTMGPTQPAMQGAAGILQISGLMGTTLFNPQGQKLGQIKDILLNAQTGEATFVLLDVDVPPTGHTMLVVPYRALSVSFNPVDRRQSVMLDLRIDQLATAPQIGNNQWQMLNEPKFLEQARNFYHATPYTAARPIETPSAPSMQGMSCPPAPCYVPEPCMGSWGYNYDPGWTEELDEFSME